MNSAIEEIYRTGIVRDELGNEFRLHSSVGRHEGGFVYDLIRSDQDIRKTLEIGCAYGLSSLCICSALSERDSAKHIIVDPYQYSAWHGIGISNLRRAGIEVFELIQEPSEFALPKMVQDEAETFDMVFIDGNHTFDHTLLDLFYANRLLRVGGYIIVDDCDWPSVANAISYILKYPAYQLESQCRTNMTLKRRLKSTITALIPLSIAGYLIPKNLYDRYYINSVYSTVVALKKIANDERDWKWFVPS